MTTEDDVNLSVMGICGFLIHLKLHVSRRSNKSDQERD